VDDRVASFLAELERRVESDASHPDTALVVSHGLTMRLLCRRMFSWSIALFESLSNPDYCAHRVLSHDGKRWRLDRPFDQWRASPDGTTQLG
jgi:broad specificity phosphatase PhoE